jgi:protein involved in polysaccharide export with SLBB domain
MRHPHQLRPHAAERRLRSRTLLGFAGILLMANLTGCSALTNPVTNGVPVRRLPPELLGESRENMETTPLGLLRQPPQPDYLLGPGDILGIWVEGVVGEKGQPTTTARVIEFGNLPPALGLPIPVRKDGTISLPLVAPIPVGGLTLEQAEAAVRRAYTVEKKVFQPGSERIFVTLQRKRQSHVLVIRQDSAATPGGEAQPNVAGGRATGFIINIGGGGRGARRGTGFALDLPAGENDVLNALARTGGFPGTDAVNEVVVFRGGVPPGPGGEAFLKNLQACPPGADPLGLAGGQTIRIPLRYRPGERPQLRPEDVVLQTGDILYIEAREADVFYTGGLLPAGEYVLPRDVDLDVVECISRIGGIIDSGGINPLNINGAFVTGGLGFPSPSLVSIVRRTPGGGQVNIRVDLNRALRDPRERILIQPKDVVLLQERPDQAFARYLSSQLNFSVFYQFVRSSRALVTGSGSVPNLNPIQP